MSKPLVFIFFSLACLLISLLYKELNPYDFPLHMEYVVAFLLLTIFFAAGIMSKHSKIFFLQKFDLVLFPILFFVLFNVLANSFNIYQISLPQFFYSLKLHRLVSFSAYSITVLIVMLFLLFLSLTLSSSFFKKIYNLVFSKQLFLLIVFIIFFRQAIFATAYAYEQTVLSFSHLDEKFENRFAIKLGGQSYYGWIKPYTDFIIDQVEENSTILIPPQSNVWKMEGNDSYLRYFLYPRKLIHLDNNQAITDTRADYLLIAHGDCGEGDCIWPKEEIPADRIDQMLIIDRETLDVKEILGDYYPSETETWGIIKMKK